MGFPMETVALQLQDVKAMEANKEVSSCIKKIEGDVTICLHPIFTSDIANGIKQELNAMSSQYSKELGGIPVGFEKVRISPTGGLVHTSPYIYYRVRAIFYLFAPEIGSSLQGTVRKKSPNHLGCLVHGMFNVSVPRPQDVQAQDWEGTSLEEDDVIMLTITSIDMSFYLPMFKGNLESVVSKAVPKTNIEDDLWDETLCSNTRQLFEDSGISGSEDEIDGNQQHEGVSGTSGETKMKSHSSSQDVSLGESSGKKKKSKSKEKDVIKKETEKGDERKKKRKRSDSFSSFEREIFDNLETNGEANGSKKNKSKRKSFGDDSMLDGDREDFEEDSKRKKKKKKKSVGYDSNEISDNGVSQTSIYSIKKEKDLLQYTLDENENASLEKSKKKKNKDNALDVSVKSEKKKRKSGEGYKKSFHNTNLEVSTKTKKSKKRKLEEEDTLDNSKRRRVFL